MNTASEVEYAAFVGIDWADRKHDVCLQAAAGSKREFSVLAHRPESIAQWAQTLRARFGGRPVAVCIELSKGPLIYALQQYDFVVIYPVDPTTLAKHREAFCLSHAKDDPTDAELALEVLITHRDKLTARRPQSCNAHPAAFGRATSHPGRRYHAHYQSHNRRPQAVFFSGARLVPR
jgi:transposase